MTTQEDLQTLMSIVPGLQLTEGTPYYEVLLKMIEEIGKDVRPSYTFNKIATEKLKKHIQCAKVLVRACQQEAEMDKKKADAAIEAARTAAALRAKEGTDGEEETKK